MSDERVPFRAVLIDADGVRHEVSGNAELSVASGVDDLRDAMMVAMERLRAHAANTEADA